MDNYTLVKPKIIRITTVPISIHKLISGVPRYLQENNFDVKLACSDGNEIHLIEKETEIVVKVLPYTREISPFKDVNALWLTYKYFKKEKPQIVHTHTPKAGIIAMLAARLSGVPIRMHTVAGLPLMETTRIKRKTLNIVEKLTSWSATNVYPNSYALKEIMVNNNLAPAHKLKVIGNGSSNGIDTGYFSIHHFKRNKAELIELLLSERTDSSAIARNDVIFTFIGRVVQDKGINELLWAFYELSKENPKVKLLLVGSQERELDPISEESQNLVKNNKHIISVGWQEDVRPFLAISDVFVFPSYREGFPNVVMQAGAMGLPSIVTNINGSNEIIEDGVNGIIIPVKDKNGLFEKMKLLANDKKFRLKLAAPARQMIVEKYEQKFVWSELLKEYKRLLDEKGIDHHLK